MARERLATDEQFIEAIRAAGGIQSVVAEKLRISQSAVSQRISRSKELQAAMKETERVLLDMAKTGVVKLIQKGDGVTCRWYLERKGKDDGFGNSTTVDIRLSDGDIATIVGAFGGDVEKLRALRSAIESGSAG